MANRKLILDYVYENEAEYANDIYMTQPVAGTLYNYTWAQVMDQARRMATYLQEKGFEPGARIAILSRNCPQAIMAELAIWMAGYTSVSIFATETVLNIRYVLDHSEASMLFVGRLENWTPHHAELVASLPTVALPHALTDKGLPQWDAVIAAHQPMPGQPSRAAEDIAMIAYTSGSTGQSKGVVHSFRSVTAGAGGLRDFFRNSFMPTKKLRMLSYLPLAHIVERATVQCVSLIDGRIQVYFVDTRETFIEDLRRARPTVFVSVPRLLLNFQLAAFAKIRRKRLDWLMSLPVLGALVKRKVLSQMGLNRTKVAFFGSAPAPEELILWYKNLGLNLLEAYAMTEDFCYSHVSSPELNSPGYAGVPLVGVEARTAENGELLIKSPGALVEYYKNPELNAQSFTEDGFFRTGDKCERLPTGLIKILGRMKEVFTTAKGRPISPAPIENKINCSPRIELCMVAGEGRERPYALVVLTEDLRARQGDAAFRAQVEPKLRVLLTEVNRTLPEAERLQMLVVAKTPWTVENGMLTSTLKIKRAPIATHIQAHVDSWYAQANTTSAGVIWAEV